ncbi:MAG: bifunctional pyr operon transcriptional regulator/uracil phosphoribosyltransferase PyrR [Microbacteriaceae bacterium]|nr:bifunctional pyr operon transcriptional regulator/uracil phosphoribosyltransferase PyrR [Microbacteriaceae bacterium]
MTRIVLTKPDIDRALKRIAHEIVESQRGREDLVFLGIPTRGVYLAQRLARLVADIEPQDVQVGTLDVTMYRDDLATQSTRATVATEIPATGIDGCTVILVDDVLFSGRTVRAALDAITALGRPDVVRFAVLVDRGHRELPIRADFVGKNLPTSTSERVNVSIAEVDDLDEVSIA